MEILIISPTALNRYRNAEHVGLMTNIRNILTTTGIEAAGISQTVFNPFRDAILAEQDIVNRALGSAYTQEMQDADRLRCQIFKRIRKKFELCELEDPSTVAYKATATVQMHILGKYPSTVTSLAYQEKSATFAGFVLDCRELLTDEQVEGIGIDSDLDDLESANIKFGRLYQQRVAERVETETKLSLKLRAVTDEAYMRLVLNINAQANDTTEANAAKTAKLREAVGLINRVIKEAKDRLNQRLNGEAQAPSDSPQGGGNEVTNGESNGNGANSGGSNGSNSGGSNGSNPNTGGNEVIIDNPGDNYE